ncbi:HNH endonuclease signature motif containing protein [Actinotalea sp. C106]|uniref:HNH endonuclease signature motif containing protein n=1 Tax=Actinotalea sp. C106 TaxID=2908644 RepID=UPI0020287178|nr:HNH endonuclease signature motif containing protein [Actinotalea sp. C106]
MTVTSERGALPFVAPGPSLPDAERGAQVVGSARALLEQVSGGRVPPEHAPGLVRALVGMVGTLELSMNAIAGQRAALLAIAAAVVQAAPDTMVPMLPGEVPMRQDLEHAHRALVADLATTMGASQGTTATLVDTSSELAARLPGVLAAMSAGLLGDKHARHVVRHAEGLPPEAAGAYQQAVLAKLETDRTPAGIGRAARLARERVHPTTATERHSRAFADRAVYLDPAADGMAWLTAFLPAVQAGAIYDKLTGIAHALPHQDDDRRDPGGGGGEPGPEGQGGPDPGPDGAGAGAGAGESGAAQQTGVEGEQRTLAQRRADVLTALTLDPPDWWDTEYQSPRAPALSAPADAPTSSTGAPTPPAAMPGDPAAPAPPSDVGDPAPPWALDPALHALRPTVAVTVPVMTLLGHSHEPGHLDGYGPIDPDTARTLAARAPSFIRILTHPETGTTLSVGRQRYTVPADLRTWLRLRDQTCRFPGCHHPATRADIDHTIAYREHGATGTTAATNLAHLCPAHHRLKHTTRWALIQHPDGHLTWTSPTGRQHTTTPALDLPTARGRTHPPPRDPGTTTDTG